MRVLLTTLLIAICAMPAAAQKDDAREEYVRKKIEEFYSSPGKLIAIDVEDVGYVRQGLSVSVMRVHDLLKDEVVEGVRIAIDEPLLNSIFRSTFIEREEVDHLINLFNLAQDYVFGKEQGQYAEISYITSDNSKFSLYTARPPKVEGLIQFEIKSNYSKVYLSLANMQKLNALLKAARDKLDSER